MKQAEILVKEINRKIIAIKESKSRYLISDYLKSIESDTRELKEYCSYKGIDFKEVEKKIIK